MLDLCFWKCRARHLQQRLLNKYTQSDAKEFLKVPASISKELGREMQDLAKALTDVTPDPQESVSLGDGKSSSMLSQKKEQQPQAFLSYSAGTREHDADSFGPGTFFAVAVVKKLHDHGIRCVCELFFSGDSEARKEKFSKELSLFAMVSDADDDQQDVLVRPASAGRPVLIVVQTQALYQSRHALREIAIAQGGQFALIPLRFDPVLPPEERQWKEIERTDLDGIVWLSNVQTSFCQLNSMPSPPYTVVSQPWILGDIVADVNAKLGFPKPRGSIATETPPESPDDVGSTVVGKQFGLSRGSDPEPTYSPPMQRGSFDLANVISKSAPTSAWAPILTPISDSREPEEIPKGISPIREDLPAAPTAALLGKSDPVHEDLEMSARMTAAAVKIQQVQRGRFERKKANQKSADKQNLAVPQKEDKHPTKPARSPSLKVYSSAPQATKRRQKSDRKSIKSDATGDHEPISPTPLISPGVPTPVSPISPSSPPAAKARQRKFRVSNKRSANSNVSVNAGPPQIAGSPRSVVSADTPRSDHTAESAAPEVKSRRKKPVPVDVKHDVPGDRRLSPAADRRMSPAARKMPLAHDRRMSPAPDRRISPAAGSPGPPEPASSSSRRSIGRNKVVVRRKSQERKAKPQGSKDESVAAIQA